MKKSIIYSLVIMTIALTLVACGSSSKSTSDDTSIPPISDTGGDTTPASPAETKTLSTYTFKVDKKELAVGEAATFTISNSAGAVGYGVNITSSSSANYNGGLTAKSITISSSTATSFTVKGTTSGQSISVILTPAGRTDAVEFALTTK